MPRREASAQQSPGRHRPGPSSRFGIAWIRPLRRVVGKVRVSLLIPLGGSPCAVPAPLAALAMVAIAALALVGCASAGRRQHRRSGRRLPPTAASRSRSSTRYGETTIEAQARARRDGRLGQPRGAARARRRPRRHEQGDLGRRRRRRRAAVGRGRSSRSSAPRRPVLFDETDGIDFEAVADTAARRHPRRLLRPHPGGVRHPVEDRAGRRLPGGGVGHVVRGHDPPQLARPSAWPTRATQLIDDLHAEVDAALADYPELAGTKRALLLHRPGRPQPDRLLHQPRHAPRLPRRASACRARRSSRRSRRRPTSSTSRSAPRRPTASPTSTSSSPTATPTARSSTQLQADPLLSQIPAIANGPDRDPRELDAARRVRQPVAAVDRLGHRRVLRPARRARWTDRRSEP